MTDVVIINTCCVTRKAEKEVRQAIRKVKRENPDCFLVVCGCWANKIKKSDSCGMEKLKIKNHNSKFKILENIDLMVGNEDKEKLPKILRKQFNPTKILDAPLGLHPQGWTEVTTSSSRVSLRNFSGASNKTIYKDKYSKSKKALVKIQDGCNNFCTYCIVPYLRGRSVSRPADKIIGEIKRLIKQGIKEVVLTGIDVASYKLKTKNAVPGGRQEKLKTQIKNFKIDKLKNDLVKLLKLILAETEIKKISFGSIGLEVFDEEFIGFIRNSSLRSGDVRAEVPRYISGSPRELKSENSINNQSLYERSAAGRQLAINNRLSSHFHIPLQSGCNATLKRMARKYKIEDVGCKIKELKKKIPNFTFSTDIMVGFPGETEEEFGESLRNIKKIKKILGKRFKKIHVFRYSSRNETVATKMESSFAKATKDKQKWGKVDEKTKKKRAFQMARITKSDS